MEMDTLVHLFWGDTIEYRFARLAIDPAYRGRTVECRLFLPLSAVSRLQIGVPAEAILTPVTLQREKPIVVYAPVMKPAIGISGPGMQWTAILARKTRQTCCATWNTPSFQ